jgi:hypothetical protein
MRWSYATFAIASTLAALPAVAADTPRTVPLRISPAQAVMNAAVFEMVVRATGRQGRFLYLNSEEDYRDPRNLTIAIAPEQERALTERLGASIESSVLHKVIAVRGIAKKTRIDFLTDGRVSGKYYYQTHLNLKSARDLTVEGEHPIP